MRGAAAHLSTAIVVVTTITMVVLGGFLVGAWLLPAQRAGMLIVSGILGLISLGCLLRAPVAYDLDAGGRLTVHFRLGKKVFERIQGWDVVREPIKMGMRVLGNGGLFAVTGLFRNREFGNFNVYVTNLRSLVIAEREDGRKIVISPENLDEWIPPSSGAGEGGQAKGSDRNAVQERY